MAAYLPFVMQQILNRPLACSPALADTIAMALSGKLNITQIQDMSGIERDRPYMERHSERQRALVDIQNGERTASAQLVDDEYGSKTFEQSGAIAVIRVKGTLTRTWGVGPYSGKTGYDGIMTQAVDALEDKSIKAIWLDINSGGGAVDGLFDCCELLEGINESNGGKPIYAMAADHAYSAAFAIATCADKVFVPPAGGVGSVGVIMLHADLTAALEEEGVKVTHIRSGDRKARGGPYEVLDAKTLAHLQAQCNEVADMFADLVARNMGLSKKAILETEGLDYMGNHAKAIGFVNEVKSELEAWAELERRISR